MQSFIAMGRLTKDPEFHLTDKGTQLTTFNIAIDRPYKEEDGTRKSDFFDVVIFGQSAKAASENFKKAQRILVEGRIQNKSWTSQDGQKHYKTEIVAEKYNYIEKKGSWEEREADNQQNNK